MSAKCFCHLNGHKVKDADARKTLEGKLEKFMDNATHFFTKTTDK